MAEENIKEVIEEIRNADDEAQQAAIEKWFESTRTDGMKIGAKFISAGVFGVIQKHLKKKAKPSLRDYQRCIDEITGIIAVQLVKKDNSESNEIVEETTNDGAVE